MTDRWTDGSAYEAYVGRWSRAVAREFVAWLGMAPGGAWLDCGAGTGALSQAILAQTAPRLVVAGDPSSRYVAFARARTVDPRARFVVAALPCLPCRAGGFDAAVAGLVLNFLPDPASGLAAMAAAVRRGGVVAAYVWDYARGMELMRVFWDAACALDPAARDLDEGARFPLCQADGLRTLFRAAGLAEVAVRPLVVPTVFRDFDDYWTPFLGGQGPAPGYLMSLAPPQRKRLRDAVCARLPVAPDGTIHLTARAWAARGTAA